MARTLRKVRLPVMPPKVCQNAYWKNKFNPKYQICAGGEKGKDSCNGDSGSPLMKLQKSKMTSNKESFYYVLIGMVSYGPPECGTKNRMGVYTRVKGYEEWILGSSENIRGLYICHV